MPVLGLVSSARLQLSQRQRHAHLVSLVRIMNSKRTGKWQLILVQLHPLAPIDRAVVLHFVDAFWENPVTENDNIVTRPARIRNY